MTSSLRTKIAITLITFENTALYFVVGFMVAQAIDFTMLFRFVTPLIIAASFFETLFYKFFVYSFRQGDVTDIEEYTVFIQTIFNAVLFFYAGYALGRLYLLES